MGRPTATTTFDPRDASTTARSAVCTASSSACCWNRSSHVYDDNPSSGNTATSARASSACRMSSMVCAALYAGSATRNVGTATATRTNPWWYKLKKESAAMGRSEDERLVYRPGFASADAATAVRLR